MLALAAAHREQGRQRHARAPKARPQPNRDPRSHPALTEYAAACPEYAEREAGSRERNLPRRRAQAMVVGIASLATRKRNQRELVHRRSNCEEDDRGIRLQLPADGNRSLLRLRVQPDDIN